MFNMKTSDLFKRAKQLADLEGSDFISWNEAVSCINESNVGLYAILLLYDMIRKKVVRFL